MNRLWALYLNEMIKISRKISSIVLMGIMTIGTILIGFVVRNGFGGIGMLSMSNYVSSESALQSMRYMTQTATLGFGLFMIGILMLILAGSSISEEISTGSIKLLIISPAKRWKIYAAKYASLLTVGLIAAVYLFGLSLLVNGLFFRFASGPDMTYPVGSVTRHMNYYALQAAMFFLNFIDIIVYLTFAFMLSILTRNTAASVGITIAVYFGSGLLNVFAIVAVRSEWLKFLPYSNLTLGTKIFQGGLLGTARTGSFTIPLEFSVVYIVTLLALMIAAALVSFKRRDI